MPYYDANSEYDQRDTDKDVIDAERKAKYSTPGGESTAIFVLLSTSPRPENGVFSATDTTAQFACI